MGTVIDIFGHVFIVLIVWFAGVGGLAWWTEGNKVAGPMAFFLFGAGWTIACLVVAVMLGIWRPWA